MASTGDLLVTGFGMFGQVLFSGRFLAQWYASEKAGRSVVPDIFWYLSVGGGLVLLIYACIRRDPVFIIGQGAGLVIYGRNLHFLRRARHEGRASSIADQGS
jgi:lipid-A-disaccharide synthase-like uncharacterized protein